jgi:hypothetical protein
MFSKWFTEYLVPRYHHLFGKNFKVILPKYIILVRKP